MTNLKFPPKAAVAQKDDCLCLLESVLYYRYNQQRRKINSPNHIKEFAKHLSKNPLQTTKNLLTSKSAKNDTKLSTEYRTLKKNELNAKVSWEIKGRYKSHNSVSGRCSLCLVEKLERLDFFFNCDSLYARLNSHYEAWSYKKKKHKKITTYRKSVQKESAVKTCLLILDLKPLRLQVKGKHSKDREFQSLALRGRKLLT